MDPQLQAFLAITACFVVPAVLDTYLVGRFGLYFTITQSVRRLAAKSTWVVVLLSAGAGLLLGHLFLTPICKSGCGE